MKLNMITLFNFQTFHGSGKVSLRMMILVNAFLLAQFFFSAFLSLACSAFVDLVRKFG